MHVRCIRVVRQKPPALSFSRNAASVSTRGIHRACHLIETARRNNDKFATYCQQNSGTLKVYFHIDYNYGLLQNTISITGMQSEQSKLIKCSVSRRLCCQSLTKCFAPAWTHCGTAPKLHDSSDISFRHWSD